MKHTVQFSLETSHDKMADLLAAVEKALEHLASLGFKTEEIRVHRTG